MQGLSKIRTELPEMLVFDILAKLPVKSLIRFKCVCKHWSFSFQTPLFITQHHHNHLRNNNLNFIFKRSIGNSIHYFNLFELSTEDGQSFSLKQNIRLPLCNDRWHNPEVYGPCNGIFCVESKDNLALWNPSTRQFRILPQSSVQRPPADFTRFFRVGFGYDSQTYDYKVLRFVSNMHENEYGAYSDETEQVDLYSLKCNSWKEISSPRVTAWGRAWQDNHVNGICYWPAYGSNSAGFCCILSFDMVNGRSEHGELVNRRPNTDMELQQKSTMTKLSVKEIDKQIGTSDEMIVFSSRVNGGIQMTIIGTRRNILCDDNSLVRWQRHEADEASGSTWGFSLTTRIVPQSKRIISDQMDEFLKVWPMITEAYFSELNDLGDAIKVACDFGLCTGKSVNQVDNVFHLILVFGVNSKIW
ncbi:hypothetical protein V6N12_000993 [Hibiscus sabdariffa]|uniref:F-box domain-containing protein n=1 Tax=Hibiscus sabdariffa TaxID=183260 RepID=A0ABR2AWT2_9ROSI